MVIALVLRLHHLDYGLPFLLYEDEPIYLNQAMNFGFGDFNPNYFKKPSFFLYSYFSLYWLAYIWQWLTQNIGDWGAFFTAYQQDPTLVALLGRSLTVTFSTATVGLVFLTGRRYFSTTVGLIAALLFALNDTHVRYSPVVISDIPSVFFIVLTAFLSCTIVTHDRRRDYFWSFAAVGLAMSFKYNAFCLAIPVMAHGLRSWQQHNDSVINRLLLAIRDNKLWLGLAVTGAVFVCLNPYTVLSLPAFLTDLNLERQHMLLRDVNDTQRSVQWFVNFPRILLKLIPKGIGWPVYLALLVSGIWTIIYSIRQKAACATVQGSLVLLAFPITFIAVTSQFQLVNSKYLLPIYPFLAILTVAGVLNAFRQLMAKILPEASKGVAAVATLLLLLGCSWPVVDQTLGHLQRYSRPDTSQLVYQQVYSLLKPGQTVYGEPETIPLGIPPQLKNAGLVAKQSLRPHWLEEVGSLEQYDHIPLHLQQLETYHPQLIVVRLKPRTGDNGKYLPYSDAYYQFLTQHFRLKLLVHPYLPNATSIAQPYKNHAMTKTDLLALYEDFKPVRKHPISPGDIFLIFERVF